MPTLDESTRRGYEFLEPALAEFLAEVGQAQEVTFFQYRRTVLPLDGYVFWLRTGAQIKAKGVFHHASQRQQEERSTVGVNDVVFTTASQLVEFNAIAPDVLFVARYQPPRAPEAPSPPPLKVAFSSRSELLRQAGIFHYRGNALYSTMATQLVDDPAHLDTQQLIVSNSLPAWLALSAYAPEWLIADNPGIVLFPSFAVADNQPPPYGTVHIIPESVRALQAASELGGTGSRYQLTAERVRISLYGCNNDVATDWLDLVRQYSEDTGVIGMMDMLPAPRDEKQIQPELAILAQLKTMEFGISYVQQRMRNVARQLIETAIASVQTSAGVPVLDFVPASLGISAPLTPSIPG